MVLSLSRLIDKRINLAINVAYILWGHWDGWEVVGGIFYFGLLGFLVSLTCSLSLLYYCCSMLHFLVL
jgi:hypothetical protein